MYFFKMMNLYILITLFPSSLRGTSILEISYSRNVSVSIYLWSPFTPLDPTCQIVVPGALMRESERERVERISGVMSRE